MGVKSWSSNKIFVLLTITATFFLNVDSLLRGYREACGTHLHARSRDTVAEGRQCDKSKGLMCTKLGVCDCSPIGGGTDRIVWNRTHCVVKLNATCRVTQSFSPELSFLPNITRTEEVFCGRGAVCTENGCTCEPDFHPDLNHFQCISENGQSTLNTNTLFSKIMLAFVASCLALVNI